MQMFFSKVLPACHNTVNGLDTGMQNNDESLQNISLDGNGQLVKILITLETPYFH